MSSDSCCYIAHCIDLSGKLPVFCPRHEREWERSPERLALPHDIQGNVKASVSDVLQAFSAFCDRAAEEMRLEALREARRGREW